MAVNVINSVLTTVNTTRATHWMEPVLAADLGGWERIVTHVWVFNTFIFTMFEIWTFKKVMQLHIDPLNYIVYIWIGCRGGWFGQDCKQQCVGHCLNNVSCNHLTGLCDGSCTYGWYGQYCNETCIGHCKEIASCNNVTGLCEGGCAAGWTGYKCDKGSVFLKAIIRWLLFV